MSARHKTKSRGRRARRSEPSASRKDSKRKVSAVFLDRDGTLTEEVGYVNHLGRVQVFPWAAEAVRKLNQARVPVIVVTNQSGVAQGYFSEDLVHKVHQKIALELAAQGARLDAIYYCPHHPNARLEAYRQNCRCRKPSTGMLDEAAKRFHVNVQSSFVVGDSARDLQMGFKVGAQTILVMTGYGKGNYEYQFGSWPQKPDMLAENLLEAVEKILGKLASRSGARRAGPRTP